LQYCVSTRDSHSRNPRLHSKPGSRWS